MPPWRKRPSCEYAAYAPKTTPAFSKTDDLPDAITLELSAAKSYAMPWHSIKNF
jgi:hypothetical protein